jgi:hypothetical protein
VCSSASFARRKALASSVTRGGLPVAVPSARPSKPRHLRLEEGVLLDLPQSSVLFGFQSYEAWCWHFTSISRTYLGACVANLSDRARAVSPAQVVEAAALAHLEIDGCA